jgi:transcriptional regulator with XRE-family HTH domain
LGNAIKDARKISSGMSQIELVKELKDHDLSLEVSQTLVARLERGLVQDPKPEILRAISSVLQIKGGYESLVGQLIKDKYGIEHQKLAMLHRRPLTLAEVADWEGKQSEIWVVATRIVDTQDPQFAAAVGKVVYQNGGEAIFFIPVDLLGRFETLKALARDNASEFDVETRLRAIPLSQEQEAVLAISFVIANPSRRDKRPAAGYLILNDENAYPYVAFEMYESEVSDRIGHLKNLVKASSMKADHVSRTAATVGSHGRIRQSNV